MTIEYIYVIYHSDVSVTDRAPLAGLTFGYALLGILGSRSFEHGANISAAGLLCMPGLAIQMTCAIVMHVGCEIVYTNHLSSMEQDDQRLLILAFPIQGHATAKKS